MGMGEPLHNITMFYGRYVILNSAEALIWGHAYHDLYSRAGSRNSQAQSGGLAGQSGISLHAPTDELRSQTMPINRRYPLKEPTRSLSGLYRHNE